jgi:Glycosyl hydrolase family 12/Ricin-type beta-trefoil lectin domain
MTTQYNRTCLAAISILVVTSSVVRAQTVTDCSGNGTHQINGGASIYQQNEWNSTLTQCASINTTTGDFTMTTANFSASGGAPATYPSIFKGCHWGLCSSNSGLPIQVNKIGSATTSWNTTQPGSGAYDVAYDLWTNSTPTTGGQPNGSEIMIWLNSRGGVRPFGSQVATASIAGKTWNVWTGRQASWNIISYVLAPGGTSFSNLDLKALIQDSVNRGSTSSSWFLIDVETGFEIWQGGQGLASRGFSFNATTGGGPTPTRPPTATPTTAPAGAGTIVNKNSGKCVDAAAAGTANGTVVQQFTCNGTNAQRWSRIATDSGYFRIGNSNSTNQVINIAGPSTADGALASLQTYGGGTNQQWLPVSEAGGFVHLIVRNSGKCLDVPAASTADGVQLQQFTCNGTAAQSFKVN